MANEKRFRIEVEMGDGCDLATTILFFQKLIVAMSKFGVTYFKSAELFSDFNMLASFSTSEQMASAIKSHIEQRLKEQMAARQQAEKQLMGEDEREH